MQIVNNFGGQGAIMKDHASVLPEQNVFKSPGSAGLLETKLEALRTTAEAISGLIGLRDKKFKNFVDNFGDNGKRHHVDYGTFVLYMSGLFPEEAEGNWDLMRGIYEHGERLTEEHIGSPIILKRHGFLSEFGIVGAFRKTGSPIRYSISGTARTEGFDREGHVEIAMKTVKIEDLKNGESPKISDRQKAVSAFKMSTHEKLTYDQNGHGPCVSYGDSRVYVGVEEVLTSDSLYRSWNGHEDSCSYQLLKAVGLEPPIDE